MQSQPSESRSEALNRARKLLVAAIEILDARQEWLIGANVSAAVASIDVELGQDDTLH